MGNKGNFQIRDPIYDKDHHIRDWTLIYSQMGRGYRDDQLADDLAYNLRQVGKDLGIKVKKPDYVSFNPKNRKLRLTNLIKNYIRSLKNRGGGRGRDGGGSSSGRPRQCIVVLLGDRETKLYKEVKEVCCKELGIITQVVLKTTLQPKSRGRGGRHNGGGNQGGGGHMNRSILSNILKQMVAKCGNRLWIVQRPKGFPTHTMLVGADVFHSTGQGKKSIVGFCASMDRFFTKYASIPYAQEELGQEIMYSIGKLMYRALKEYKKINDGALPELIIFYRDGVGESQVPLLINIEIPEIKKSFKKFGEDYNPKFAEITVNKRIDDRFFLDGKENPNPGTITSSDVTSNNFEFFLVAQNVTCGTVTGTKFFVIHNENTGLTQDQFWCLTHNQCYNYYNWPGAIRVPAPCFYAHKLGYLVGQTYASETNQDSLKNKLYYL